MFNILFDISPSVPVIVLICLNGSHWGKSLPISPIKKKPLFHILLEYSNPMRIHLSQRYPIISQVTIIPVYRNYIHHIPLYWLFPHHFPISWCVKSDENPIFYIFLDIKIPFKSHKNPLLHLFPSFSHEKTHENPRSRHGSPALRQDTRGIPSTWWRWRWAPGWRSAPSGAASRRWSCWRSCPWGSWVEICRKKVGIFLRKCWETVGNMLEKVWKMLEEKMMGRSWENPWYDMGWCGFDIEKYGIMNWDDMVFVG